MGGLESVPETNASPVMRASTPPTSHSAPPSFSSTTSQPSSPLSSTFGFDKTPPTDPESPFYTPLFQAFADTSSTTADKHIETVARLAIKFPSDRHAAALTTALRAAVHRIRDIPTNQINQQQTLIGALRFTTSCISYLQLSANGNSNMVCLALAAGDAESALHISDRIDLGRSLIARAIIAAMDILTTKPQLIIAKAAIQLILVCFMDSPSHGKVDQSNQMPISALVDRYPRPAAAIRALLKILMDTASIPTLPKLLAIGTEMLDVPVEPIGSTTRRVVPASVGMGLFTASASAIGAGMQAGLNDAWSALSSRMTLKPFIPSVNNETQYVPNSNHTQTNQNIQGTTMEEEISTQLQHDVNIQRNGSSAQATNIGTNGEEEISITAASANSSPRSSPRSNIFHGWLAGLQVPGVGVNTRMKNTSGRRTPSDVMTKSTNNEKDILEIVEYALTLLCFLCLPGFNKPYREAMCCLQDTGGRGNEEETETENSVSFSRLYESLGKWIGHPQGGLLCYLLLTGNRRLRTFTLARTDPDVLLIPLLASLRRRCTVGVAVDDAYFSAAILLCLTSDKGFCEAIDEIDVPLSWLTYIEDGKRIGNEYLALSGLVLLVCCRVVQQSIVSRRKGEDFFLASIGLGIMCNVGGDTTRLHPLAAERLLSLVEFIIRRRRKLSHSKNEKNEGVMKNLNEMQALSMEILTLILRARSSVGVNRHLVYALLHSEGTVEAASGRNGGPKCQAIGHILRRVVVFFGKAVDEMMKSSSSDNGNNKEHFDNGISVERVFAAIDRYARSLPRDVLHGLPAARYEWQHVEFPCSSFTVEYCWRLCPQELKQIRHQIVN